MGSFNVLRGVSLLFITQETDLHNSKTAHICSLLALLLPSFMTHMQRKRYTDFVRKLTEEGSYVQADGSGCEQEVSKSAVNLSEVGRSVEWKEQFLVVNLEEEGENGISFEQRVEGLVTFKDLENE